MVRSLLLPRLFQGAHPLIRVGAQLIGRIKTREITVEGVKIDHGCKVRIDRGVLPAATIDIVLHRTEAPSSTTMDDALLLHMCNQYRLLKIHSVVGQVRLQDGVSKDLFRSAFDEHVKPGHQCGPPPMTFFSQISPSE